MPLIDMPIPIPPSPSMLRTAGLSKFMGGTLRGGAGDERLCKCFCGVFVEGVGVAIAAVAKRDRALLVTRLGLLVLQRRKEQNHVHGFARGGVVVSMLRIAHNLELTRVMSWQAPIYMYA